MPTITSYFDFLLAAALTITFTYSPSDLSKWKLR